MICIYCKNNFLDFVRGVRRVCYDCSKKRRKLRLREKYLSNRDKILGLRVCVLCESVMTPETGFSRKNTCKKCRDDVLERFNRLIDRKCIYCGKICGNVYCSKACCTRTAYIVRKNKRHIDSIISGGDI